MESTGLFGALGGRLQRRQRHRQVKEAVIGPRERYDVPAHVAEWLSSGYRCQAGHLAPRAATFRQELSSSESGPAVAAGAEVITHNSERSEKALRLLR